MKQKLFVLSVICSLCISFTACSSNKQANNHSSSNAQTTNIQGRIETTAEITTNSLQEQSSNSNNFKSSESRDSNSNNQSDNEFNTYEYHENAMPLDDMLSAYETPADIIEIDENSTNPSNKDVLFEYDDLNRIVKCCYTANSVDFIQTYTYSDTEVHIYSFCGSIIVDDIVFSYTYDADIGFTEHNGYYFNRVQIN